MYRILATANSVLFALLILVATAMGQTPSTVSVRLVDTISSGGSQRGDTFSATLATPLVVNNRILAERGERITGQVRQVVRPGGLKQPAVITLSLRTIYAATGHYPLRTSELTIKGDSHAKRNLLIIGGSAGLGALVGGAAAGGRGAAIGAAAGAGAGTGGAYLTGKQEIVLPSETLLTFHVNAVTISPKELAKLQDAGQHRGSERADENYVPSREPYPAAPADAYVMVERRHRHHGEDGDDVDDEHGEHHGEHYIVERPRTIEVIFIKNHQANVAIYWPHRVEHLMLAGDDLNDICEPLAQRTGFSVDIVRTKIRITGREGEFKDHHESERDKHDD
ncbi:MAG TPA: hypothetical protein VOA64_13440 [Candidatus Dormibacteraeota bacterium]|nr:hypothetical protein [Candidatus Dormibacteraeota bacterium]